MASEVSRISEALSERMVSAVERAIQTHSNPSPATSSEQIQEDIRRLDSKVGVSLRAFSREVEELREWMTQSIEGHSSQAARERKVTPSTK